MVNKKHYMMDFIVYAIAALFLVGMLSLGYAIFVWQVAELWIMLGIGAFVFMSMIIYHQLTIHMRAKK